MYVGGRPSAFAIGCVFSVGTLLYVGTALHDLRHFRRLLQSGGITIGADWIRCTGIYRRDTELRREHVAYIWKRRDGMVELDGTVDGHLRCIFVPADIERLPELEEALSHWRPIQVPPERPDVARWVIPAVMAPGFPLALASVTILLRAKDAAWAALAGVVLLVPCGFLLYRFRWLRRMRWARVAAMILAGLVVTKIAWTMTR